MSFVVRFNCQALVVFKMIVDEMDIENSLRNSKTSGLDVEAGTIKVKTVGMTCCSYVLHFLNRSYQVTSDSSHS